MCAMAFTREVRYTFKDDTGGKFSPSDCDVFYIGDQPWLTLHPYNSQFARFVKQADTSDKTKYRLTNHQGYGKILEIRNEAHLTSAKSCGTQLVPLDEPRSSKAAATDTLTSLFGAQSSAPPESEDEASEDDIDTGTKAVRKTKRGFDATNSWPDAARIYESDELEDRKFTIKLDGEILWILRPASSTEAISIPCEIAAFETVVKFLREHTHEGCFDPRLYTKSGKYQKQSE